MTGRPRLYPEEQARLKVRIPRRLAQRLDEAGHQKSRFIATTLEAFLDRANDTTALLEKQLSLQDDRRLLAGLVREATDERNQAMAELRRIRREASNTSRALTQHFRAAPPAQRPELAALRRRVRALLGDVTARLAGGADPGVVPRA